MRPTDEQPERLLTFRSGGWVIAGALAISTLLVVWATAGIFIRSDRPAGNGRDIDTYGFDLAALSVPRSIVRPAMPRRDMVHPMDDPTFMTGVNVAELAPRRGKYLVPSDRVIGVEIDGRARAYPITVLNVHEVVHDTLGDTPIAVTYSWPSDCVAVYDRRVGDDVLQFGISGLLCNANTLLYDRGERESLWCQINGIAVSGPHVGTTLTPVSSVLVSWQQWLTLHPDTTVVDRDPAIVKRRYNKADPRLYLRGYVPLHPIDPAPPPGTPPSMTPVVVATVGDASRVYPVSLIAERADADGRWDDELDGTTLSFWYAPKAETVYVSGAEARYALWFAWHAFHPDCELARRGPVPPSASAP